MPAFKYSLALAAMAAAVGSSAVGVDTGVALGSGSTRIAIKGLVPVICHASVTASLVPARPGSVSLGELKEFCNSAHGYRVHADYSASLANARLIIDGTEVELLQSGTTVISQSDRPGIDSHTVAVSLPEGVDGGALSFRVEPL
jgi:hypothetical protein